MGKREFIASYPFKPKKVEPMFPQIEKIPKVFKPTIKNKEKRYIPLVNQLKDKKVEKPLDIDKLIEGAEKLEKEEMIREGSIMSDEAEDTVVPEEITTNKVPLHPRRNRQGNLHIPKKVFIEESLPDSDK